MILASAPEPSGIALPRGPPQRTPDGCHAHAEHGCSVVEVRTATLRVKQVCVLKAAPYGRGIEGGVTPATWRVMRECVGTTLFEAAYPQSDRRPRYSKGARDRDGVSPGSR